MDSMSVTVCKEDDAGTDRLVGLGFETDSNAVSIYGNDDFHHRCTTGVLDRDGKDDWEKGKTELWKRKELGDCGHSEGRYRFNPQKELKVRVFVNPIALCWPFCFMANDEVAICNIRVSFTYPYLTNGNKTQWEWSGKEWIGKWNRDRKWHQMKIIQGS